MMIRPASPHLRADLMVPAGEEMKIYGEEKKNECIYLKSLKMA